MRRYLHLSDDEREQIGLARTLGHSIGAIAQAIGRPKSTISRELSRNKLPSGRYSPLHAAGAYQLRRRREALIERDRALRTFVVDRLAEGWTPEQISGWLKAGNEHRLPVVGCETIYAFIYRAAQRAEQLWRYLTRRHKRRRPRRSRASQDTIKDRVSIHERPKTVDGRTEGGHWEGDLPVVRAINTAPLVMMSGQVIDGVGLDRNTGLVHRIDPLLRACVPTNPPTEEDVRAALTYLLDEWLVDVALDRVGKCIAIMLAMTLIERALLPERPAFFVTAGQRGGGKTTLVIMITLAALGRRAAAAAWSGYSEERKKALFSYLRQSLACLVWDNIPRGAEISCPHIEAALTASDISDRVLGVSQVETVPSTTVQIFTGNSIKPRGDMASRSLMLALNVDRPDPENRAFEHADPLAWTQANRPKIVRALYTLLIAGALNRPKQQEAKTRFKTWWHLVGWPMEYAASLLGIEVDCTELMRAGEVEDEEASAVSAVLTIMREIWRDRTFTAMDVVEAMTPGTHMDHSDTAKAETLADALAELAGRQLERPSARSIGKFLGNRLVNRPAWIGDGQTVATLKKSVGHNANTYRIHVSASGEDQKHSPHSPHSPNRYPGGGEMGNEGNGGKDIPVNEVASPSEEPLF